MGGEKVSKKFAESDQVEKDTEERKSGGLEVEQPHRADGDENQAEVAAEVADSAQKLDGGLHA